jgi:hypothetical protein
MSEREMNEQIKQMNDIFQNESTNIFFQLSNSGASWGGLPALRPNFGTNLMRCELQIKK